MKELFDALAYFPIYGSITIFVGTVIYCICYAKDED